MGKGSNPGHKLLRREVVRQVSKVPG
jgi:hypothetical protein